MTTTVAAFTGSQNDPSSRFRVRQFVGPLIDHQIVITDRPNEAGRYPPARRRSRPLWFARAGATAARNVFEARGADISWFQRELVSTVETFERCSHKPRVLDVDDAIFLDQRFGSVDRVARSCAVVICGNSFLADHFDGLAETLVAPTAVDTDRYRPAEVRSGQRPVTIGWMGTASNLDQLALVASSISQVLALRPAARCRVVTDAGSLPSDLQADNVELVPWRAASEIKLLQDFDIGLMPLRDSPWARGKCGYKILTYMSTGVPAVASPVGVNTEILESQPMLLPANEAEWTEVLLQLVDNADRRSEIGADLRQRVIDHYSVDVVTPILARAMQSLVP